MKIEITKPYELREQLENRLSVRTGDFIFNVKEYIIERKIGKFLFLNKYDDFAEVVYSKKTGKWILEIYDFNVLKNFNNIYLFWNIINDFAITTDSELK